MSTKLKAGTASSGAVLDADTAGILELQTGSTPTTAVYVDASQNVGIGVTPSANSLSKGLDLVNGSGIFGYSNSSYYTSNAYYNSGWKYKATAGATAIFSESNGEISFYNAASGSAGSALTWSERMRINAAGDVIFAKTNPYITSLDSSLYAFGRNTSSLGVYLTNNATSWASTSDERRKDIIEPITDAVNKVSTLRTVIGKFKVDEEGVRRPFLIAQDVQAVFPEAVNAQEDEEGEFLGMSYTDMVPFLVAAIKELNAKVTALEAQLGAK